MNTAAATKATWNMNSVELAKAFAEVAGIKGRTGGHIYDRNGKHVAHGWDDAAELLTRKGVIQVGVGINWRNRYALKLMGN